MTVWKLIPVPAGAHVIARVYAGTALEHLTGRGTLELRREEYGDLAVRLGAAPGSAFDTVTGRPRTITVDVEAVPTAADRIVRLTGWLLEFHGGPVPDAVDTAITVMTTLADAIQRVRDLHRPETVDAECDGGDCCAGTHPVLLCAGCSEPVEDGPCPTVALLEGIPVNEVTPPAITVTGSPGSATSEFQRGWREGAHWRNAVHAEEVARAGRHHAEPASAPVPADWDRTPLDNPGGAS